MVVAVVQRHIGGLLSFDESAVVGTFSEVKGQILLCGAGLLVTVNFGKRILHMKLIITKTGSGKCRR